MCYDHPFHALRVTNRPGNATSNSSTMARSNDLKPKRLPFRKRAAAGVFAGVSLLAAALSAASAAPTPEQTFQDAWSAAATLRATEAHALFDSLRGKKELSDRDVAYGTALTFLDVQPKTDENVARAADLFARLAKENPDDMAGQESRFFLARIAETPQRPADPVKAEQLYRALFHDHPESAVGQLALEKATLVGLYANTPTPQIPARFAEFEALGAGLTDPAAAPAFHLILGLAAIEFGLPPAQAFDHLAAAERIGVPGAAARATNLVRLGRLAQKLGRKDAELLYWGEFVRLYPHDNRNYVIRQELLQLGGQAS